MGRKRKDKRQRLLQQFSCSQTIRQPGSSQENNNEEYHELETESTKKIYTRKFVSAWKLIYPWAYPIYDEEGKERIKCSLCTAMKMSNAFGELGSTSLQKQALAIHNGSQLHKVAYQRKQLLEQKNVMPIEKHVELMVDSERSRIITTIQIMFRIIQKDLPLEEYEDECRAHMYMQTPNMPIRDEYSAYINPTAGKELLSAMYTVYWEKLKDEISSSPFYSILVDESTDRRFEKHLILYITYLKDVGFGPRNTVFVKLLSIEDGKAQTMYLAIKTVLQEMGLSMQNMVAMGSDGAVAMIGRNSGLISKLQLDIPHLVGVHCIAHREALVVKDACGCFAELVWVDKFANKVREWIGNSSLRREEVRKLMLSFLHRAYEILKINGVRWLSRGMVMKRLAIVMPILLQCWKGGYKEMYKVACNYQLLFLIFFLTDLLKEVDMVNIKFQAQEMDISMIGRELDVFINVLRSRYLSDDFANGSQYLSIFFKNTEEGVFSCSGQDGAIYKHQLSFSSIIDKKQRVTIDDCIYLAKAVVQRVISNFEERFHDHQLFNAAKLFSPRNYSKQVETRSLNTRQY